MGTMVTVEEKVYPGDGSGWHPAGPREVDAGEVRSMRKVPIEQYRVAMKDGTEFHTDRAGRDAIRKASLPWPLG